MKKEGKIILTDIKANRNRMENIENFQRLTGTAFTKYAVIKLALNYFTFMEMIEDMPEERKKELEQDNSTLNRVLHKLVSEDTGDMERDLSDVLDIRSRVTAKMKILTAYTDALEIYEYVLNRREAEVKGDTDSYVDSYGLADEMFRYVFSDSDKLLVNSKIQAILAQLPVRITKNRFLDILTNTLTIYKGGEQKAVEDFVEMLLSAAVIGTPEGFDSEYPDLYETYCQLRNADYRALTMDEYLKLTAQIEEAAERIQNAVTDYLMLQEIVNDVLILLFTKEMADPEQLDSKYKAAASILGKLTAAENIYASAEEFDALFEELPGAQEECYEELSFLSGSCYDLDSTYDELPAEVKERFLLLQKADRLTSSSLFMNIEQEETSSQTADEAYIEKQRENLTQKFTAAFQTVPILVQRSMMAKVLSVIPVFFNSQQEIKDYFEYALSRCGDDSELLACERLLRDLMEE